MGTKVFVGGLPWALEDHELREAFAPYGDVTDAKVITDRDTGKSRGFGFVTYSNQDGVQKAIEAMDQSNLGGRTIKVSQAEDKRPGGPPKTSGYSGYDSPRSGGYSGGYGGDGGGGGGGRKGGGRDRW